jgi:hypothetical protein
MLKNQHVENVDFLYKNIFGLKILRSQGHVGSIPTSGTT